MAQSAGGPEPWVRSPRRGEPVSPGKGTATTKSYEKPEGMHALSAAFPVRLVSATVPSEEPGLFQRRISAVV